ncbi:GGDEF domain-containing protein [Pseudoalteromonas rubra]|uniref:GGDEF domain-containing protein n=1 Tax=Pseudoalteromonas rubra TaxID=43658 RepID=A0A5S3WPX0_9GAMM|nr:EAL domain-containing protein [Pseudoalteromonas rubra]TMP30842.1 GGDEF domain-containing protein [Pseudoalteromonas rubra]TMP34209.1 GGDEF domain-containing protein [Pseudoalteromonas rubra]
MKHKVNVNLPVIGQCLLMCVLTALMVYFFRAHVTTGERQHEQVSLLFDAKSIDAKLDKFALALSVGSLRHFDELQQLDKALHHLTDKQQSGQVGAEYQAYLKLLSHKMALMEQLKTQAVGMRNGLTYLPLVLDEMIAIQHPRALLASTILASLVTSGQPLDEVLLDTRIRMLAQTSDSNESFALLSRRFVNHIQVAVHYYRQVHKTRQQYLAIDSKAAFASLYRAQMDLHAKQLQQTGTLSEQLFGLAVVLLLMLLFILQRLNKAKNRALQASQLLHDAIERLQEGFALYDSEGTLTLTNQCWLRHYGVLSKAQFPQTLDDWHLRKSEFVHDQSETPQRLQKTAQGRWLQIRHARTAEGGYVYISVDVTEFKEVEAELKTAAAVYQATQEGIMTTNADLEITAVNPAFTRITGYQEHEVLGKKPNLLSSGRHDTRFYEHMWQTLETKGEWAAEIWNRRKDGTIYPEWLAISSVQDEQGQVQQYIAVLSDMTERKEQEAKIAYQAMYDALTGLPNRRLLLDRISQDLKQIERQTHLSALLFIDLDRFKRINDAMGHDAGDNLLLEVANRLNHLVRRTDTLARFGGDEFVLLLSQISDVEDAAKVAEKILTSLALPFTINGFEVISGASIGIAIMPDDAREQQEILRRADLAMYKAKESGRNQYHYFAPSMQQQVNRRVELEQLLRRAIANNELAVFYQPIIELKSGQLYGFEALTRWPHEGQYITPDEFIPVAEESGLISELGEWMLTQATSDIEMLNRSLNLNCCLSANISSQQYRLGFNATTLRHILRQTGFAPGNLALEITESILLDDDEAILAWLEGLRATGAQLSIDDFGTGYSSLSYLRRFPINTIKIDKSFIHEFAHAPDSQNLVRAILSMAASLGLSVIAEGVEHVAQLEGLKEMDCDLVQGYVYAKPMSLMELQVWCEEFCQDQAKNLA